jgi:hypothetical protein
MRGQPIVHARSYDMGAHDVHMGAHMAYDMGAHMAV